MKLEELKKMIKEEFDSFVEAETEETETDAGEVDVDVDSDEVEAEKNPEETLRSMYDMLKDYFEGEEEMGDEEAPEDVEGGMGEEEPELEENSTTEAKYQKSGYAAGGKSSSGANAGYGTVGGKGGTGFDAGSKALKERFQKLANIIK